MNPYPEKAVELTLAGLRQDQGRHWILPIDKRTIKDTGAIIEHLVTVVDGSSLASDGRVGRVVRETMKETRNEEVLEQGDEVVKLQKIVRYEHGARKALVEEKLHIVASSGKYRVFVSDFLPDQTFNSMGTLIAALSLTTEGQNTLETVIESLESLKSLKSLKSLGEGASGGRPTEGVMQERRLRVRKRKDVGSREHSPADRGRKKGDQSVSEAAKALIGIRGAGGSSYAPLTVPVALANIKWHRSELGEKVVRLEGDYETAKAKCEKARAEYEKARAEYEKARSEREKARAELEEGRAKVDDFRNTVRKAIEDVPDGRDDASKAGQPKRSRGGGNVGFDDDFWSH